MATWDETQQMIEQWFEANRWIWVLVLVLGLLSIVAVVYFFKTVGAIGNRFADATIPKMKKNKQPRVVVVGGPPSLQQGLHGPPQHVIPVPQPQPVPAGAQGAIGQVPVPQPPTVYVQVPPPQPGQHVYVVTNPVPPTTVKR